MDTTRAADEGAGDSAHRRLATYGSLAPGRPNHHQLDGLVGGWVVGHVHGQLREAGWGAAMGFPGLVLDDESMLIDVHLFESDDLADHWDRLDAFEGDGYERVIATVHTSTGTVAANIYVLADRGESPA